jgi:hypothetical protein
MDSGNISRSKRTYIGKIRSNFLGTRFLIYDTQAPYNGAVVPPAGRTSRRFNSTKVSPKLPSVSYNIAQVSYELNVLGTRGPRRMRCIMHSIPASSVEPGGTVPGQPEQIVPRALEDSFRSTASFSQSFRSTASFSKSIMDSSMDSSISGQQCLRYDANQVIIFFSPVPFFAWFLARAVLCILQAEHVSELFFPTSAR